MNNFDILVIMIDNVNIGLWIELNKQCMSLSHALTCVGIYWWEYGELNNV